MKNSFGKPNLSIHGVICKCSCLLRRNGIVCISRPVQLMLHYGYNICEAAPPLGKSQKRGVTLTSAPITQQSYVERLVTRASATLLQGKTNPFESIIIVIFAEFSLQIYSFFPPVKAWQYRFVLASEAWKVVVSTVKSFFLCRMFDNLLPFVFLADLIDRTEYTLFEENHACK